MVCFSFLKSLFCSNPSLVLQFLLLNSFCNLTYFSSSQLPSCFVYKAPPRTSADGYRASNFPKDFMWSGKLKIVAKGREASIFLLDANNAVFAASPVTEGSVERTVDSGRYFVLKIVNPQGKHAYIGLAFNERNDAFDLSQQALGSMNASWKLNRT